MPRSDSAPGCLQSHSSVCSKPPRVLNAPSAQQFWNPHREPGRKDWINTRYSPLALPAPPSSPFNQILTQTVKLQPGTAMRRRAVALSRGIWALAVRVRAVGWRGRGWHTAVLGVPWSRGQGLPALRPELPWELRCSPGIRDTRPAAPCAHRASKGGGAAAMAAGGRGAGGRFPRHGGDGGDAGHSL